MRHAALVLLVFLAAASTLQGCGDETTIVTKQYSSPAVPEGLTATPGEKLITLSWRPVSGAGSYNIYWDTSPLVNTTSNSIIGASSPYRHERLDAGVTYYYIVAAMNMEGEGPASAEVSASPLTGTLLPAAPGGITVTGANGEAVISWRPVEGASSYNLYWNTSGTVSTSDSVIIGTGSPFTHSSLSDSTSYFYAVTAVSAEGEGPVSNTVSVTPRTLFSALRNTVYSLSYEDYDECISDTYGLSIYMEPMTLFGYSTAIKDSYAIAGAPYLDSNPWETSAVMNSGAAFLYKRYSGGWSKYLSTRLYHNREEGALFGLDVDLSSQHAIVGAPLQDVSGKTDTGAVYIYDFSDLYLTPFQLSEAVQDNALFGLSVAVSDYFAVVGSPAESDGGLLTSGAAYLYQKTGINTWTLLRRLVPTDGAEGGAQFGYSVELEGDSVAVSAPSRGNGGAVYIYSISNTTAPQKLLSPAQDSSARFGSSLSMSGRQLLVGAPEKASTGGAAYLYHINGATWSLVGTFEPDLPTETGKYGFSVSVDGDYTAITSLDQSNIAVYKKRKGELSWGKWSTFKAGSSVALSGNEMVVGNYSKNITTTEAGLGYCTYPEETVSMAGAVYFY